MEEDEDKGTSTKSVQTKNKRIQQKNPTRSMDVCVLCCVTRRQRMERYTMDKKDRTKGKEVPSEARYCYALQNVPTGPGAHPASCTMGTGSLCRGLSDRTRKWITSLLMPGLRMGEEERQGNCECIE
jgi:hypothetical protein